jgi:hypothetical protein
LGGPVDVRVEVDTGLEGAPIGVWDSTQWDQEVWATEDPPWADLTPYVFAVELNAGAARWGERFETGSAVLTVDNTTGIFTAESEVEHWPLPFRPGRLVRVVAIPDATTGTKIPLGTGIIEGIYDHYDDAGHANTSTIECVGHMSTLAAVNPLMLTTPTGVQTTDERVETALDRAAWPAADRVIQPGEHTMQTSFLAETVLEECQRAADAEGGAFYTDNEGRAVFKARDWLTTDARSINIQGYLGYWELPVPAGTSVWDTALWDTDIWESFEENAAHIISVVASWEAARVINQVGFARVGGFLQTAEDTLSQDHHGIRSYQRTDLENDDDADVALLADRYVDAFSVSRLRIDQVTLVAVEDAEGEDRQHLFYDTRFGDRLSIRIQTAWGWGYTKEVHVMGINHRITADDWTMTLRLDDAQTFEGSVT